MPEQARASVLVLLARLIARGALGADTETETETETGHPASVEASDSGEGSGRV